MRPLFSFFVFILGAGSAFAWPPTFGPEFEFTNHVWVYGSKDFDAKDNAFAAEAIDKIHKRFVEICKTDGCVVDEETVSNTFSIAFPNQDFQIEFTVDPRCVEVKAPGMTTAKWRQIAPTVQKYIFDVPTQQGYYPRGAQVGINSAGHVNIGARSAFDDSGELLLRFAADFHMFWELSSGILNNDHYNARPLAVLDDTTHEAFQNLVNAVESGREAGAPDPSLTQIARQYQDLMLAGSRRFEEARHATLREQNKNDPDWKEPGMWSSEKSISLNLSEVTRLKSMGEDPVDPLLDKVMEIRGIRGQHTANEFVLLAQLFENRIAFLREQSAQGDPIKFVDPRVQDVNMTDAFYIYVTESKLKWDDYKGLCQGCVSTDHPSRFLMGGAKWGQPRDLLAFMRAVAFYDKSDLAKEGVARALLGYSSEILNKVYLENFSTFANQNVFLNGVWKLKEILARGEISPELRAPALQLLAKTKLEIYAVPLAPDEFLALSGIENENAVSLDKAAFKKILRAAAGAGSSEQVKERVEALYNHEVAERTRSADAANGAKSPSLLSRLIGFCRRAIEKTTQ